MHPEITATKRLGRPVENKVQPPLVHVDSAEMSRSIINQAKKLRQSNVEFVKNNIYINSNMTKAEALAAYELRCKRREAQSKKIPTNGQLSGAKFFQPGPSATASLTLNPTACPYVPTAANT